MEGIAVKPLTVSFHEGEFLNKLNGESKLAFWFQLNDEGQEEVGNQWGPANVQALNRYSYVQNNPLKWTDPTGHQTEGTPNVSDLKPLPSRWVKELGGEKYTSELKEHSGGAKANLFYDPKTGKVYSVVRGSRHAEEVGQLPRDLSPGKRGWPADNSARDRGNNSGRGGGGGGRGGGGRGGGGTGPIKHWNQ